jgi:putative endonuclease
VITRGRRTRAQRIGDDAERRAEALLRDAGLIPIERNWHCRAGEIDLIMRDGEVLVFVEVRARAPGHHAGAAESVGPRKRERLIRSARHYLATLGTPPPCRFDVVAFEGAADRTPPAAPDWIRHAFDAD